MLSAVDLVVDNIRGVGEVGGSVKSQVRTVSDTIYSVRLRLFRLKFGLM